MNFKASRLTISVPLTMITNLNKKVPNFKKKLKKIIHGQMLGEDRPEKNSAKCVIRSGEIPSPRQTSVDKSNVCVMKSERGALVRGSDPPSGHSVYKTTGGTWRAPARRLIQTHLGAAVWKSGDKMSRSFSDAKNRPFFRVWEKSVGCRGQLLAP